MAWSRQRGCVRPAEGKLRAVHVVVRDSVEHHADVEHRTPGVPLEHPRGISGKPLEPGRDGDLGQERRTPTPWPAPRPGGPAATSRRRPERRGRHGPRPPGPRRPSPPRVPYPQHKGDLAGQRRISCTVCSCLRTVSRSQSPVQYTEICEIEPSRTSARSSSRQYHDSPSAAHCSSTSSTNPADGESDRKSPRLNSSHVRISY